MKNGKSTLTGCPLSSRAHGRKLITDERFSDIRYGIKLANRNIGFNGKFYTIPYFLTFMLKRFLSEKK